MLVTAVAKMMGPGYPGGRARLRWVAAIGEDGVGSGAGMSVGGGACSGGRRGMASRRWCRAPRIGEDCAWGCRICSGSCANLGLHPRGCTADWKLGTSTLMPDGVRCGVTWRIRGPERPWMDGGLIGQSVSAPQRTGHFAVRREHAPLHHPPSFRASALRLTPSDSTS